MKKTIIVCLAVLAVLCVTAALLFATGTLNKMFNNSEDEKDPSVLMFHSRYSEKISSAAEIAEKSIADEQAAVPVDSGMERNALPEGVRPSDPSVETVPGIDAGLLKQKSYIIDAFAAKYGLDPGTCHIAGFYGNYGGADAVLLDSDELSYIALVSLEYVAGSPFYYTNGNRITVYRNGTFCSLEEAYGSGLLSAEDIADISREYMAGKNVPEYADR